MTFLLQTINILVDLVTTLIILRVVLSWFMHGDSNPLIRFLNQSTDPILKPIKRILPTFGYVDFSPLVAILALEVIRNILNQIL